MAHLVDGEVDAGVRHDADDVGQVSAVEVPQAAAGRVHAARAVRDARVLAGRADRQPHLDHLKHAPKPVRSRP